MIRLALLSVLLAGCAAPPPRDLPPLVLTPEVAREMPAAEVCLGVSVFRPGNAEVAAAEVKRRGLDCREHAAAMTELQRQMAQPAPRAQAPIVVPVPEIRPMDVPSTVYCSSYPSMGTVRTICR